MKTKERYALVYVDSLTQYIDDMDLAVTVYDSLEEARAALLKEVMDRIGGEDVYNSLEVDENGARKFYTPYYEYEYTITPDMMKGDGCDGYSDIYLIKARN